MWLFFCYVQVIFNTDMEKSEYFSKVMRIVTELTDVDEADILGCSRKTDVVDARWMVICLLRESGWSTHKISGTIGHSERTVNHALASIDDRIRYGYGGLGNMLAIARQLLQK